MPKDLANSHQEDGGVSMREDTLKSSLNVVPFSQLSLSVLKTRKLDHKPFYHKQFYSYRNVKQQNVIYHFPLLEHPKVLWHY